MPRNLIYIISISLLAGILLCLPLWFNDRIYPVVPVIEELVFHGYTQWALLCTWVVGFVLMMIPRFDLRKAIPFFLLVSLVLALQDKIRWQPWLYQYLIMLVCYFFYEVKLINKKSLLDVYRIIISGIYFWSGVHKINSGFTEKILPNFIGIELYEWGYIAAIFEALLGVGLFVKPIRNYSLIGIWGMHLLILYNLLFGSYEFDMVILPWNIAMMILAGVLFWNQDDRIFSLRERPIAKAIAVLVALILPSFLFFEAWNTYMSFALFSGKENRAYLYVGEDLKNSFRPETI